VANGQALEAAELNRAVGTAITTKLALVVKRIIRKGWVEGSAIVDAKLKLFLGAYIPRQHISGRNPQ
jgi:hypothetical protein